MNLSTRLPAHNHFCSQASVGLGPFSGTLAELLLAVLE
jgi:hypothetical protein